MKKYTVFEKLVKKSDDELARLKNISFGHITPDALLELGVLSSTQLESAFSFGFVRNPYDRAVSLFAYLRRQRAIPNLWSFDSFLRALAREKPEAGLWNVIGLSQAAPMVEWMRPRTWQGPTLTLKFEDLDGSLRELSAYLPIPPQLPHFNPSRRGRQPVVVSPRGLDFIKEFYSEDFAAFEYSLDVPEGLFALKK